MLICVNPVDLVKKRKDKVATKAKINPSGFLSGLDLVF